MGRRQADRKYMADEVKSPFPVHTLDYTAVAGRVPHALTPENLVAIAESKKRFKPIKREVSVAVFDAWSVGVFAVLTTIFSITSPPALLVGIGMGVVAWVEFSMIKRLKKLDPAAPWMLCLNQLGFAGVLILYALYNLMFPDHSSATEIQQAIGGADPQMAAAFTGIEHWVHLGLYLGVIAFAVVFQGGCAVYHYACSAKLKRYVGETAPWILQLHEAGLMN